MGNPRRSGWVVLLAVAAFACAAALAVRLNKRKQAGQPALLPVPAAVPPPEVAPEAASRSLVGLAVGGAAVVVLSLAVIVVTRPADTAPKTVPGVAHAADVGGYALTDAVGSPMTLANCQAQVAKAADPLNHVDCGYDIASGTSSDEEPVADPHDPQYAGAALPENLSTNGQPCLTGRRRPVLDTMRPALSASFTPKPGIERVESTFQIRGLGGLSPYDTDETGESQGQKVTLQFLRFDQLGHNLSYRWRVRLTPPNVEALGWSAWCEFTIPKTTSDDLGLDKDEKYEVTLSGVQWRAIVSVPGPVDATLSAAATSSADRIPITLKGSDWASIAHNLAYQASQTGSAATWKLTDDLSAALHGPKHLTMGFPRT